MNEPRDETAKTGRDDRGRFAPGNPGRPPGTRTRATRAAQALLDGESESLTRRAIELAMGGDGAALRLCLERICPPRKDGPIAFAAPRMETAGDAAKAMSEIVRAVAEGELTPAEGQAVAALVELFRRSLETGELETRIAALEGRRDHP